MLGFCFAPNKFSKNPKIAVANVPAKVVKNKKTLTANPLLSADIVSIIMDNEMLIHYLDTKFSRPSIDIESQKLSYFKVQIITQGMPKRAPTIHTYDLAIKLLVFS